MKLAFPNILVLFASNPSTLNTSSTCSSKIARINDAPKKIGFLRTTNHGLKLYKSIEGEELSLSERMKIIMATVFITTSVASPAFAASFEETFSIAPAYKDPLKAKALQDINNLKDLQDSRLDICAEKGKDWEQCFLFGESSTIPKNKAKFIPMSNNDKKDDISKTRITKSPPTW
jgi:hypothetical protein